MSEHIASFKTGREIVYDAVYLGCGPVENRIPARILNMQMEIPGELSFSLQGVTFQMDELDEDETLEIDKEEFNFIFEMNEIEGEKACHVTKIYFVTLHPGHGAQRLMFFTVCLF